MRHYHIVVVKGTTRAVHTVASLSAVLRVIRQWTGWADEIERYTCHRRRCHPLRVNSSAGEG